MKHFIFALLVCTGLSGCSNWVYKYDISQGNYLNQDDVDKLRIEMTKEQVEYVLGTPLIKNPFKSDRWFYVYTLKSGKTDKTSQIEVVINFADGKLISVEGDLEVPEEFNTPLDAS